MIARVRRFLTGMSRHRNDPATAENVAKLLLKIGAVSLRPKKPFRFVSGILSPIYVDVRLVNSYPIERKILVSHYVDVIKNTIGLGHVDVISGTATASIALAAWIADILSLPMIYARSSKKDHGKGRQLEGLIRKGQRVVVIEDMVSTGGSSLTNVQVCREEGKAIVEHVVATYTHQLGLAQENFKQAGVSLHVLTNFETVVRVASENGYMKPRDAATVLAWNKDTKGWGKKMGFE